MKGDTTQPPPSRSWFRRNAIWFIPTVILGALAIPAIFIGSILYFVFSLMSSSEPYRFALESARNNHEIIQTLGEPIDTGWFTSGAINLHNDNGDANLSIPVHGPLGSGTIYLEATKSAGRWTYSLLKFVSKDSSRSIILKSDAEQGAAANPYPLRGRVEVTLSCSSPLQDSLPPVQGG